MNRFGDIDSSFKQLSVVEGFHSVELVPLEKELSHYIKIAYDHCHYPNEHELLKDRAILKILFPYLKLFDTALELLPVVKESVWRGVLIDIGKKVSGYTAFENEDEIILRIRTQFRVKVDGSYIVHLIEITNDNDQVSSSTQQTALSSRLK